jgi:hypothetical protein
VVDIRVKSTLNKFISVFGRESHMGVTWALSQQPELSLSKTELACASLFMARARLESELLRALWLPKVGVVRG